MCMFCIIIFPWVYTNVWIWWNIALMIRWHGKGKGIFHMQLTSLINWLWIVRKSSISSPLFNFIYMDSWIFILFNELKFVTIFLMLKLSRIWGAGDPWSWILSLFNMYSPFSDKIVCSRLLLYLPLLLQETDKVM